MAAPFPSSRPRERRISTRASTPRMRAGIAQTTGNNSVAKPRIMLAVALRLTFGGASSTCVAVSPLLSGSAGGTGTLLLPGQEEDASIHERSGAAASAGNGVE